MSVLLKTTNPLPLQVPFKLTFDFLTVSTGLQPLQSSMLLSEQTALFQAICQESEAFPFCLRSVPNCAAAEQLLAYAQELT